MENKGFVHFIRDRHAMVSQALLFVMALGIIVFFFPRTASFKYEFQRGKPWTYVTLLAPFSFDIPKPAEVLKKESEEIISGCPLIFQQDREQVQYIVEKMAQAFLSFPEELETSEDVLLLSIEFLRDQLSVGIIGEAEEFDSLQQDKPVLIVLKDNVVKEGTLSEISDVESTLDELSEMLAAMYPPEKIGNIKEWLNGFVSATLHLDVEKTVERELESLSEMDSLKGTVLQGEVIIQQGEIVSEDIEEKLSHLALEFDSRQGAYAGSQWVLVGQTISVGIVLLLLFIFLRILRPHVLEDNTQVSFVLLNVVLMSVLASWLIHKHVEYLYLAPFCMLPLVIRAFYDSRLALFVHLTTVLIIGIQAPNPFEFSFLQLVAGIITVLLVQNVYKRGELFSSALKIIGIYILAYVALTFIQQGNPNQIDTFRLMLFGGSGVLSLFANPLIYFYEKTFSLVSDVTLLEYSDTNNPLLRQLSERAPGTFQHSLQVANLSESVVQEIGGNGLLMRVGALYHDIGKMKQPVYFIENQVGGVNPHDELPFEESAEIIINHMKEGVAMAKKNGLPDRIIDFIRTHHGTSTVQFFYKQYLKNYPDEMVEKSKFSYPGPLPYTKEMAVLMMVDSVEAASRSLPKKDALSIEKLVDTVVDRQLAEGQFNQAQITLKEITTAKAILKRKLLTVYHLRIEYPE